MSSYPLGTTTLLPGWRRARTAASPAPGDAAWGWVLLALGVVEVVAGIALFIGARWARVVAVLVAGFNGVVQLAFLAAYPVGAVLIMVVSALVIWTVIKHGDAARV